MNASRADGRRKHLQRHSRLALAAAGTAAWAVSASLLNASPVFNVKLLGRNITQGGVEYTSQILDSAVGDIIEYQLVGNMSPIGTVYSGTAGFTITSLNSGPDGVNSLRFDLFQTTSQPTQVNFSSGVTLQNNWDQISTNSPGGITPRGNGNNDVSAIRPGHASNIWSGLSPEVVFTGTFAVSSSTPSSTSIVQVRWSTGSGGLHVNGTGLAKFPNLITETGSNPYLAYLPLYLGPIPPPPVIPVNPPSDTKWGSDASGIWNTGPRTNGNPAYRRTALLGAVITAPRTVTIDRHETTTRLYFDGGGAYTVDGTNTLSIREDYFPGVGTITQATVNVYSGNHTITAPLSFETGHSAASLVVAAGASLATASLTTDGGALVKTGGGTLIVGQRIGWATQISQGTVRMSQMNFAPGIFDIDSGGTWDLNGHDQTLLNTRSYASVINNAGVVHLGTATLRFDVTPLPTYSSTLAGTVDGSGGVGVNSGTLVLVGAKSYTGPTTVNLGATLSVSTADSIASTSQVNLDGGTLLFSGAVASNRPIVSSSANTATVNTSTFNASMGPVSGSGPLTKSGAGTLTVNSLRSGALTVSAGTVKIAGALGDASTSLLPALPSIAAGAALDLNDSKLIIQFGTNPSPLTATRAAIIAGRGGTDFANAPWNGAGGINSTAASSTGDGVSFAIGCVENSSLPQLGLPSYTSFGGQSVDSGSMLIRFTRGADCNLDGKVNTDDVTIVGALYNSAGSDHWSLGDFDYDGICDSDDVTVLGALYDATAPAISSAQLTAQYGSDFAAAFERGRNLAAIPEPAGLAASLACLLFGSRRSRRAGRSHLGVSACDGICT